jgi:uncharacterized membrane protein YphA (DoxX/SURF4 family)
VSQNSHAVFINFEGLPPVLSILIIIVKLTSGVKGSALLSANLRVPDVIGAAAPRSVLFLSLASAPPRGIRARDRSIARGKITSGILLLIGLMFALVTLDSHAG